MVTTAQSILYLSAADVHTACEEIDPLACIHEALVLHAHGEARLPLEAYLAWSPSKGGTARSINMPSWVGGDVQAVGTKIINANPDNVQHGLSRASGLTILFDQGTARPVCIMDGALISGLRTAAVSALAAQRLCVNFLTVGLLGAGEIAERHALLLTQRLAGIKHIRIYDLCRERGAGLVERVGKRLAERGVEIFQVGTPKDAVEDAALVITCTTTRESYLGYGWLRSGAVAINVSLDDLDADVLLRADRLYVDDWSLIVADQHRLLGRLARAGKVVGPGEPNSRTQRAVTGTLGQLLAGSCPARQSDDEVIVVNPFGMSIEDIAMAHQVYRVARQRRLGHVLPR